MSMEPKDALLHYQFAERAKSELIIASQLVMTLTDYKDDELKGARRMLLSLMDLVRNEIEFGHRATNAPEFIKSIDALNEAISLIESDALGPASVKLGEAISQATTVAQNAWGTLEERGFL
jgi:hypothetical protein